MADITDFKKRLQAIREAVIAKLPDIAETVAISAKAMAERNIKEAGFGVMYSTRQVPAWFFHGKELNSRGTKFLEQHGVHPKTGAQGEGKKKRRKNAGDPDPGSFDKTTNWGELRAAQGLQKAFIDLGYSNKMWANMAPVAIRTEGDGVTVAQLGATNREAQNKMTWNFIRYGDYIRKALTPENGNTLGEIVISEVLEVVNQVKI